MNIIGLASSFAIITGLIFSLAGSPSSTFGSYLYTVTTYSATGETTSLIVKPFTTLGSSGGSTFYILKFLDHYWFNLAL